ncbi:sugar transporter family protein [Plasmopara halstedii]|uniref:Sugar transporter family protein n=1 Tax=Plasmopara halstedii TaxID=4781 RepID=A0A0P1AEP5_PLAHL|nr:sugar transporter family protein [Plasmopara halstedii]CEG39129.1 sugar transporter family protein [Plasmopara halstedii]|eukprot:XP_024575498.1 sugar transporter family protein [Plasmopara halstedii]
MPPVIDFQVAVTPDESEPSTTQAINDDRHRSIGEYCRTRLTTLKPPMTKAESPLKVLALLDRMQWLHFLVAFIAWCWDAFDFFTVTMTISDLAETFGKTKTEITWGITLVLMLRSVGAITFGIASDRWGRKWPFVVNNLLFIVLELATGFCSSYTQFLVVRALFGIAMGGLYGNVAATALEDCPLAARGISRLPETKVFQERQRLREASRNTSKMFVAEGKIALKRHWLLLCYMVLLMAGFNFMSHGSQDMYPTMLKNQYEFNADQVTVTQIVANIGAICGGTLVGYYSQVFGRRLTILVMTVIGAALLYPYCYTGDETVMIAAFFMQFCVQGAWGVIPIHLMELSPPSYSAFVVGTAYQLGNLVSSASSTIEASLGEHFPLPDSEDGETRFEYGKVISIFLGVVFVYVFVLTLIGPEARGKEFDVKHDHDLDEAARISHDGSLLSATETKVFKA